MKQAAWDNATIIQKVRQIGTPEPIIEHMLQVNEVAMALVTCAIAEGFAVDRDVVRMACLTHDVGIPQLTQEFVAIPEYGADFKVEVDHLIHIVHSARIVRQLGFSEAVELCVLRHALGPSNQDLAELGLPPLEREALPCNDTEEAMAFADFLVWMVRTGNNPWADAQAPVRATWPFLNVMYRYYTDHGISQEHPFVQRYSVLTKRWLPLARPEFLPAPLQERMASGQKARS